MNTRLCYFDNTLLSKIEAMVLSIGQDDVGHFIVLDQTIFYPQGGGQPSDIGFIDLSGLVIPIHHVKLVNGKVHHYTDKPYPELTGKRVHSEIDASKRWLHAKLHTAGHLLASLIGKYYPGVKAIKGHHFADQSYVQFDGTNLADIQHGELNALLNQSISSNVNIFRHIIQADEISRYCPNLPYQLVNHSAIYLIKIDGFEYQPCAGTHINKLGELRGTQITTLKIKKNKLKISYQVT